MILGLGTDWIEIGRVEQELARSGWAPEQGVFTAGEISDCGAEAAQAGRYAACFAAKEAVLKALGVRVDDLRMLREVETACVDGKSSEVILHDRLKVAAEELGVRRVRLSTSRSGRHAAAIVILEN